MSAGNLRCIPEDEYHALLDDRVIVPLDGVIIVSANRHASRADVAGWKNVERPWISKTNGRPA